RANAQADGIAPRPLGPVRMDDVQFPASRKIDVEVALILAEIRGPHDAGILVQRGGHRPPVDQVLRVPDDQPGYVVEARVREIEVIAYADGACVRMVAAEDRVAERRRPRGLCKGKACAGWQCESSRKGGRVGDEASSRQHGRSSLDRL